MNVKNLPILTKSILLGCIVTLFFPTQSRGNVILSQFRNEISDLVTQAGHCLVSVKSHITIPGDTLENRPVMEMQNVGIGLVMDSLHILVKARVIEGGQQITVCDKQGIESPAVVIGSDDQYSLSMLRVQNPLTSSQSMFLSNSYPSPFAGEPVLILCNSLDIFPAVTVGMVNCIRHDGLIQLSADLPAGTSGGVILNFEGQLLGFIAVEIDLFPDELPYSSDLLSSETILAYPMDEIIKMSQHIIKQSLQPKSYLGVVVADWPSQLGGAHIRQIHSNSPAEKHGLQIGDIILSTNNHKVANAYDLFTLINTHTPGDQVALKILRGKEMFSIVVEIESLPQKSTTNYNQSQALKPVTKKQEISTEFLQMRIKRMEQEIRLLKELLND